jgi:hypothetical protein
MLTADTEQTVVLEEMMKKVKESSTEKVKELERQGEEGKRSNEAELQRLRLKQEVSSSFYSSFHHAPHTLRVLIPITLTL